MRDARRWLMALLSAFALVAASCGDGDDGGPSPGPDDTGGQIGGSLEVAAVWTGAEQDNFERVIAAFEASSGAEVTYTSAGDDIGAFLGPRLEGGEPPDVAMIPQPGLIADLAEQGSLQPIEDAAGEALDENFAPVWRELGSVDGELFAVWWKAANKSTVWYNTQVFADAGVEPPEDFDGLLEAAETIKAFGVPPFSVGADVGWPLTDWFENIYLRQAGPEMYDQLARHEIPWTDQSVKDALETFAEVVGDEENLAGGRSGALQTNNDSAVTNIVADPPAGAMVSSGDFAQGIITGTTEAVPEEDFNFFPFPSIEGSDPSVLSSGDAAVMLTEGNEAAEAFMEFVATPEAAEQWIPQGGFTSPSKNVDTGIYPDELSTLAAEQLAQATVVRFDMSDLQPAAFGSTTGQGMWGLLTEFVRDPTDVDGIAERLEAAAKSAFE